jgi:hypothetical protein
MDKYKIGQNIICNFNSIIHNCKKGDLFVIDNIILEPFFYRIHISCGEVKLYFDLGSELEKWFIYDKDEVRQFKLKKILND